MKAIEVIEKNNKLYAINEANNELNRVYIIKYNNLIVLILYFKIVCFILYLIF